MPYKTFKADDERLTAYAGAFYSAQLDWQPSFGEVLSSAFELDNTISSLRSLSDKMRVDPYADDDYDPFQDIEGFEPFASEFVFSRSPTETARIKRRIKDRARHREVLGQASTFQMLGAEAIAGVLDPVNLLFVTGAPGIGGSLAAAMSRNISQGAKIGFGAGATTEAILHADQSDRELSQSIATVLASTGLGGALVLPWVLGRRRMLFVGGRSARQGPDGDDAPFLDPDGDDASFVGPDGEYHFVGPEPSPTTQPPGPPRLTHQLPGNRSFHDLSKALDKELNSGPSFATGPAGFGREPVSARRHATGKDPEGSIADPDRQAAGPPSFGTADAYGVEKFAAITSPAIRVLNSGNREAANTVEALVETATYMKKNFEGRASEQSVETLAKQHRYALAEEISGFGRAHAQYRKRMAGQDGQPATFAERVGIAASDTARTIARTPGPHLTLGQFRVEVTRGLRADKKHLIPEVQASVTRTRQLLDRMGEEAVAVRLLAPDELMPNYVPRVWNQPEINAHTEELVDLIYQWQVENRLAGQDGQPATFAKRLAAHADTDGVSRDKIRGQIEEILTAADGIEGLEHANLGGAKGIFRERTIDVPDEIIERFIENDIDTILRSYMRQAAIDIELQRKFGSVDLHEQIGRIQNEAKAKANLFVSKEVANEILAKGDDAIMRIEAMRDILRGVYGLPDNPYAPTTVAARLALDFNNWTMLGGVTLSSLPDMGRIVMTEGFQNAFPMIRAMITDFKSWKMSAEEVRLAGTSLDMVLQTRALALSSVGELPQRFTNVERTAGYVSNAFFMANLLSPWNAFIKQAAGTTIAHRMLKEAGKLAKGTISPNMKARFLSAGIDDQMARNIAAQFEKYGEVVNGLNMANSHLWDDKATQRAFRAALARDTDSTILTPGAGDQPLFAHKIWGRILTQYKSFVFTSASRVMLPAMQMRDRNVLHGMLMMTFIGGLVVMLKDRMNGRATVDSIGEFALDGIDQSGITSWLFSANNAIEAVSDNQAGIRPMLGMGPWWDSTLRWKVGSVFGPSAGQAVRAGEIASDMITGDEDYWTRKSAYRFVPGNNLFYLRLSNVFRLRQWMDDLSQAYDDAPIFDRFGEPDPKATRARRAQELLEQDDSDSNIRL